MAKVAGSRPFRDWAQLKVMYAPIPRAIHCTTLPVARIRPRASSAIPPAAARFTATEPPWRRTLQSVKGGSTALISVIRTRIGSSLRVTARPSLAPRTGSRRVRTHSASNSPGAPTAMNAICQPFRPMGGSVG